MWNKIGSTLEAATPNLLCIDPFETRVWSRGDWIGLGDTKKETRKGAGQSPQNLPGRSEDNPNGSCSGRSQRDHFKHQTRNTGRKVHVQMQTTSERGDNQQGNRTNMARKRDDSLCCWNNMFNHAATRWQHNKDIYMTRNSRIVCMTCYLLIN